MDKDGNNLYVLAQSESRFFLINYDAFCKRPELMLQSIFAVIGVDANAGLLAKKIHSPRIAPEKDDEFDLALLARAKKTYSTLSISPKNITLRLN